MDRCRQKKWIMICKVYWKFFFWVFFPLCFSCSKGNEEKPTDLTEIEPFYIQNLGVNFMPWDTQSSVVGDFRFTPHFSKLFSEFGDLAKTPEGNYKELPHFSYIVQKDATIKAIAEGEVVSVYFQLVGDYDLAIQSENDPKWIVYYDHISEVLVEEGDHVYPGMPLGKPKFVLDSLGFIEIMINNTEDKHSYCPFEVFNPATSVDFQQQVIRLIKDWEHYKNDTSIYNEESFIISGCRKKSILSY